MIQLSGAGKRFGHKLLFEDLTWMITPQDRVGLVGGNGTGKSTLLKILAGMESLDYGELSMQKGITFGYLPQEGLALSGRSVMEECMTVFADLADIEREMESLTHRMGDIDPASAEYMQVADRFHELDTEFRTRDGYTVEAQVGTVLTGLGFKKEDWSRRTEEFSGGWQMRISLAKLLLQKPNLLLLDEPTNHLDLETRNWLEDYLRNYPYAYVVISHDRYFLDVTVDRMVEIWNKHVHFYSGNYEKYLREKQQRLESLVSAYKNQRDRIEQLEAFISRFRYQATKAKQVQSRIKELEKIERIEVPPEEKTIHFTFPQPKPSGRVVAEGEAIAKSYGEKHVFEDANFLIERGDRVALVGPNGAGKSTLIKLLAGSEKPTGGTLKLGHNVEVDYFAQDQYKELPTDRKMIDDLSDAAPRMSNTELRSLLGCFLFSEDDVFKPIGVLSGGERNRYALARMLLQPSNFLLLDEPTNHLDLRAKDVLLESLSKFTGTVVFVSHDRYFIDKLATRVFEVGDGSVHVYPGNYEDYIWRKEKGDLALEAQVRATVGGSNGKATGEGARPAQDSLPQDGASSAQKRVNPIKMKQMTDRCMELEQGIACVEKDIGETETALTQFVSAEETQRLYALLESKKAELQKLMSEWEGVSQAIEIAGR
jgi:ATP-binding cassette, subfamily F, member 3